jgi:hypothetical protein
VIPVFAPTYKIHLALHPVDDVVQEFATVKVSHGQLQSEGVLDADRSSEQQSPLQDKSIRCDIVSQRATSNGKLAVLCAERTF